MICDKCGGKGKMIVYVCDCCSGVKVICEDVELDVEVMFGVREGEELLFEGESDESFDFEVGDVVIKLWSERNKNVFRRRDINLYILIVLGLDEVLLGFECNIIYLDDYIVILYRRGVI